MPTQQAQRTAIGGWKLLALAAIAGLIGAPLVRADPITNFYTTGVGHGYDSGSGMGQGDFPSACVNGAEDGYDFCMGTKRIMPGTIFTICWMRYAPSPAVAGQARLREAAFGGQTEGQDRMYLAQRTIPAPLVTKSGVWMCP